MYSALSSGNGYFAKTCRRIASVFNNVVRTGTRGAPAAVTESTSRRRTSWRKTCLDRCSCCRSRRPRSDRGAVREAAGAVVLGQVVAVHEHNDVALRASHPFALQREIPEAFRGREADERMLHDGPRGRISVSSYITKTSARDSSELCRNCSSSRASIVCARATLLCKTLSSSAMTEMSRENVVDTRGI
jgi:hypothetical protein